VPKRSLGRQWDQWAKGKIWLWKCNEHSPQQRLKTNQFCTISRISPWHKGTPSYFCCSQRYYLTYAEHNDGIVNFTRKRDQAIVAYLGAWKWQSTPTKHISQNIRAVLCTSKIQNNRRSLQGSTMNFAKYRFFMLIIILSVVTPMSM